ncbi:MAG: NnrU family protein [Pseudomonadota bacterium]
MSFFVLILGLALWWATHLAKPMSLPFRTAIVARGGEGAAKVAMLAGTLAAVALMINGYKGADYIDVWVPPLWLYPVNNLLMVLAIVVFFAGNIPGNVRAWIRHPQLTGLKLWALAHLLVNGDLASIILFGGLLAWGVVALIAINKRDGKGRKPAPEGWKPNAIHAGVSVVAFTVITGVHNWAGVSPFGGG